MRVQTRKVIQAHDARPVIEMLESRVMLSGTLPMISDLLDARNTVVRIETDLGDIDIELFDVASPRGGDPISVTTTNFLDYLFNGDIDNVFFHRLVSGFVLQGGGFRVNSVPGVENNGLREVETEDPIVNEFNKFALLAGTSATIEPVASVAARVFFPTGTDLSGIEVGDWIRLPNIPGSTGNNFLFEVENVSNDFVRVTTSENVGNHSNVDWTFFPKVNVERTIAMAKLGSNPDSATNQWFINLDDNSENLDNQNGGFTVFARVITDASWTVVTNIAALAVDNFVDINNPISGALTEVPVQSGHTTGGDLDEDFVVDFINVEVIKRQGSMDFFTESFVIPEGYVDTGAAITETLKIANASGMDASFQIIFHYEKGERDQVVLSSSIASLRHLDVPLTGTGSLITEPRFDTPFSIEIQSTTPLTATLRHSDFGGTVEESFVSPTLLTDTWGANSLMSWGFADPGVTGRSPSDPGATFRPFLLWHNTSNATANITATFFLQGGGTWEIQKQVGAYRRGGLEIFNLQGVTNDVAGISVQSDQGIVAILTAYESFQSADGGYSMLGIPGGGASIGYVAGVTRGDADESHVAFLNTDNGVSAIVTLEAAGSSGVFSTVANIVVPPSSRSLFNLNSLSTTVLPDDEFVTLRYRVINSLPVAGSFVNSANGDLLASPFESVLSTSFAFADVRFNESATGQSDTLSIYNIGTEDALVRIFIMFDDDSQLLPEDTFSVAANGRLDIDASMFPDTIRAKMNMESSFSLIISGVGMMDEVPFVAQYTHFDANGAAITYLGSLITSATLIPPPGSGS